MSNLFKDRSQAAPEANPIGLLCEIGEDFGIEHFTYFCTGGPAGGGGGPVIMTSYPSAWIQRYQEKSYHRVDPVVAHGVRSLLPVDWLAINRTERQVGQFFHEATEHGVRENGITVPIRDEMYRTALLSINMSLPESSWQTFKKEFLSDLTFLAYLFHERVRLAAPAGRAGGAGKLSKREREVLQWAALGKTAWETSQILDLSEGTVAFYLKNSITKLGASNKTEAVALAMALGSIELSVNTEGSAH